MINQTIKTQGVLLVLNAGSSSVKFRLFDSGNLQELASGGVSGIGDAPVMKAGKTDGTAQQNPLPAQTNQEDALRHILQWIESGGWQLAGAAHRVVHGGTEFTQSVIVNETILNKLAAYSPLAPLHQPHNLAAIGIVSTLAPNLPQVACFDTAFHSGLDALHYRYALPENDHTHGIRRYGFHGLSYEWIALRLREDQPELFAGNVIAAHLGNGSSLCAMRGGKSIDTSMGMTSLEGVPMGTRSGSIDPGILIYLAREGGLTPDALEHLLYHESGLKGLSGLSGDVRTLMASGNQQARFALDFYALKVAQHIAMLAVSLGGADALVFTGGIGENADNIRKAILAQLPMFAGMKTLVIPANEERIMAMHAQSLIG